MSKVLIGGPKESITPNLYYPRLQVNRRGEIILATYKQGMLTTGILVGKTPDSKSTFSIGTKITDWEVAGPLQDYQGEVTVTFANEPNQ